MTGTMAVLPVLAWAALAAPARVAEPQAKADESMHMRMAEVKPQDPHLQPAQPPPPHRDHIMIDRGAMPRMPPDPRNARAWVGGGRPEKIDLSAERLEVPIDTPFFVATGGRPRAEERPEGRRFDLPLAIHTVNKDGAVEDVGRPYVFADHAVFQWEGPETGFKATVMVGLDGGGARHALASPVTFLLSTTARKVDPDHLDFTETETVSRVDLFDQGEQATVELTIMPLGMPDDVEKPSVTLDVRRPLLDFDVSPKRLLGFGLQTAEVTAFPRTGSWPAESGLSLIFGADDGGLDPSEVVPLAGKTAHSRLRSSGMGSDVVRVSGAPFATEEEPVTYVFPTTFLCAALLGGIAGSISAVRLRKKRSIRRRDLGTAAVTGLVAAVAYACGVNLIGIDLGPGVHEALVFTIGAVAALVGLPGLKAKAAASGG